MGSEGSRCLGGHRAQAGVLDPVQFPSSVISSSDPLPFVHPFVGEGSGSGERIECLNRKGSSRTSSFIPGLLLEDVCGSKGIGVLETYNRSINSESFCHQDEVQNGDSPVSPVLNSSGRLDVFHRSPRRLPPNPYPSDQSEVPPICHPIGGLSIQGSLFRVNDGPSSIHSGHGSCSELSPSSRNKNVTLHRRLVDPCFVSRRMSPGEGHCVGLMSTIGNLDKFRKVSVNSSPKRDLSGNRFMFSDFEGFSDSQTEKHSLINHSRISILKEYSRVPLEASFGPSRLHDPVDSRGTPANEVAPVTVESQNSGLKRAEPIRY